jgi:hypothetical protein
MTIPIVMGGSAAYPKQQQPVVDLGQSGGKSASLRLSFPGSAV